MKLNRGKLVILVMVFLGCATGVLSISYHHGLSRRSIAWWGPEQIELIAQAPHVEAMRIFPAGSSDAPSGIVGYTGADRKIVDALPGVDHLRHGLLEDANFRWQDSTNSEQASGDSPISTAPVWAYALLFTDRDKQLWVLFDAEGTRLGRSDRDATLPIAEHSRGWQEFFREQFSAAGGRGR